MGSAGGFKAVHNAEASVCCRAWEEADEAVCGEKRVVFQTVLQAAPDGGFTGGHQVWTGAADNGRGIDKNISVLPDRRPFQVYRAVRVL